MDPKTLNTYETNADGFIRTYSTTEPTRLYELIRTFFVPHGRTIDIGCGSGRDINFLKENSFKTSGLDTVSNFVSHCKTEYPSLDIFQDSLPKLSSQQDGTYKNVLLSAVLMHVPSSELIEAVSNILRITAPGGRILISIRSFMGDHEREPDGRLFIKISKDRLIDLFENLGATCLFHETQEDENSNKTWLNFVFEKRDLSERTGLESIQEIIIKDKKDTSYKLALIRSLIEISRYDQGVARYDDFKEYVYLPLKRLAFYWLKFYFPLLATSEKVLQSKSHSRLAFEEAIKGLGYPHTDMNVLLNDLESCPESFNTALKKIANTIKVGPMRYIGSSDYEVFKYFGPRESKVLGQMPDGDIGVIGVPVNIWRDLSTFGHWIEDSIIVKWARLTECFNKNEKFEYYFKLLNSFPSAERRTLEVKNLFKGKTVECIWSKKSVSKFDIDHAIPYSLWKNNDLWNLLPSCPRQNNNKRDTIPSPDLVKRRKDMLIHYWSLYKENYEDLFNAQILRTFGVKDSNWENPMFDRFYVTITRLAVHKICDVWQPK